MDLWKLFFFFTYRSNYIDLYLRFSTNELGWWAVANSGGIVSNIFRFFTRVAKSSEKKRKQNKNTKQNRHSAEDKENISWVSSFFKGETRVDIRTDQCTRNNYKWEIGSLHVQVR